MATDRVSYVVSPNLAVALDTTWNGVADAPIALTGLTADLRSLALPPSGFLGTLDLDIDTIVGAATIQAMITWDAAGTKVLAGPAPVQTLWAGTGAPAGRSGVSITLERRPFQTPSGQTVGTVYLWLRLDAGTANLSALGARLHWFLPGAG